MEKLCEFESSQEFTKFIRSLIKAVDIKKVGYILLKSAGDSIVGYSCDNHRLAKQVFWGNSLILSDFKIYIAPLRVYPTKADGKVSIFKSGNSIYVSFSGVQLENKQPESPYDFSKSYEAVKNSCDRVLEYCDKQYLIDAVSSLSFPPQLVKTGDTVAIEVCTDRRKPIKVSNRFGEVYIMPRLGSKD